MKRPLLSYLKGGSLENMKQRENKYITNKQKE